MFSLTIHQLLDVEDEQNMKRKIKIVMPTIEKDIPDPLYNLSETISFSRLAPSIHQMTEILNTHLRVVPT